MSVAAEAVPAQALENELAEGVGDGEPQADAQEQRGEQLDVQALADAVVPFSLRRRISDGSILSLFIVVQLAWLAVLALGLVWLLR